MVVSASKKAKRRSWEMCDRGETSGSGVSVGAGVCVGVEVGVGVFVGDEVGVAVGGRGVSDGRAAGVGGARVAACEGGSSVGGTGVAVGSMAVQPMTRNEPSRTRVIALFRADILFSLSSCQLK